ncbi:hypothetical protein EZV62_012488 [Acer yangbiense]|uniref:Protein FAR1-RELATED SEQUENCE n=1 Tax=Acer yangbiense TaxID=1000413 RepID=A0A5C7HWE8_9ROSI|nr:hypothetical protein EZV62_012488 [Acer yangbiense]
MNQDAAMVKAILQVMPDTYHTLCTWHIMQNALKHMNSVFRGPSRVKDVLSAFMNDTEEEEEFLTTWSQMIDQYNVHNNNRLSSIFDVRAKWAYAYVRRAWSVGMRSTQLSESFNASLKDYLNSGINMVSLKIPCKMLSQAREVYRKAIFKEFQEQLLEAIELVITNYVEDDRKLFYTVDTENSSKKRQVIRESDDSLSCSCRMFEIKEVLCSHVIIVLRERMSIKEIPISYILKRWTKQARVESVQYLHGHSIEADPKLQQTCRYRSLCSVFTRISSRVSESEKAYNVANEYANNLAKLVENILCLEMEGNIHEKNREPQDLNNEVNCTQDSNLVKAKGLKKKETSKGRRRIKSSFEKSFSQEKEVIKSSFTL